MKKTYIAPATELVVLNTLDVIASSTLVSSGSDDIKSDIFDI